MGGILVLINMHQTCMKLRLWKWLHLHLSWKHSTLSEHSDLLSCSDLKSGGIWCKFRIFLKVCCHVTKPPTLIPILEYAPPPHPYPICIMGCEIWMNPYKVSLIFNTQFLPLIKRVSCAEFLPTSVTHTAVTHRHYHITSFLPNHLNTVKILLH